MRKLIFIAAFLPIMITCYSQRDIVSLNGSWNIAESIDSIKIPGIFPHQVDVPGLVRNAEPAFPDVDKFISADYNYYWDNPERLKLKIDGRKIGVALQNRNYFWYKRSFRIQVQKEIVILKVNKAQFGSAIWINRKLVVRI